MNPKHVLGFLAILIIFIIVISGCTQPKPPESPGTPSSDTPAAKSCNTPSDCGSFYDCINSKCVKIMPPALP